MQVYLGSSVSAAINTKCFKQQLCVCVLFDIIILDRVNLSSKAPAIS